jgi:hypothetical protein
MSDFATTWELTRKRFVDALQGLNHHQLNWRLHPGTLTLAEAAVHLAGVEVWFVSQLTGEQLDSERQRLSRAATDGAVNDNPFPFSAAEMTPEFVMRSLEVGENMVRPVISSPTDEMRQRQIKSALGPVIDGSGALARLSFHPGYHQGQAHLIQTAPGFPK